MKRYTIDILNQTTGLQVLNGLLTVKLAGTATLAIIYATNDVNGATLANPLTSQQAAAGFYVPDGYYDLIATDGIHVRTALAVEIFDPTSAGGSGVTSFNGRPGAITLTGSDVVGALGYAPTSIVGYVGVQTTGALKAGLGLVKSDIGLGSVDNTSDDAKVVFSAGRLTTPRLINGVAFNGTQDININAVDATARQPLDDDLTAIAALNSTGLIYRRGANNWAFVTVGANLTFDPVTGTLSASVAGGGGGGDVYKADNLSGLGDNDTALANLGAGIGAGGGRALFKAATAAAARAVLALGTLALLSSPAPDGKQYVIKDGALVEAVLSSVTSQIASFADGPTATIPVGTNLLRTAEYAAGSGMGGADYIYDAAVTTGYVTANPLSSFRNGTRGYRLANFEVCPEHFGGVGNGTTNDTLAFNALNKEIARRGGGVVFLQNKTYIHGLQTQFTNGVGTGTSPLQFANLSKAVIIRGNGATLKTPDGLKYGSFDPATGAPRGYQSTANADIATPFNGAVDFQNCTGPIRISDLNLDGNMANFSLGGGQGDTGRQIPHCGLYLTGNTNTIHLENITARFFGEDGMITSTPTASEAVLRTPIYGVNLVMENNGRNGYSMIGGRGSVFINCKFNNQGKSRIYSAPGAGLDIEAEGGNINRDSQWINCEFANNTGLGMVSDSGDSARAKFSMGTIIGTTNYALWPEKPNITFEDCTIIGATTHCYPGSKALATRFMRCQFLDAPSRSPTGTVYVAGGPIVDLGGGVTPTLFDDCDFILTNSGVKPYTLGTERYNNCRTSQASATTGVPSGIYTGQNEINGAGNYVGVTVVEGKTTINGTDRFPAGVSFAAFTPTVVDSSGVGVAAATDCSYRVVDGVCEATFKITLSGGGAGFLKISLPASPTRNGPVPGKNANSNKAIHGEVNTGDSKMYVYLFDGTYPGASGDVLQLHARYRTT